MLNTETVGFVGGGVMCEAIVISLLKGAGMTADRISISEPLENRRRQLAERYGVVVSPNNAKVANRVDICILSVKPQIMSTALAELRDVLKPSTLVISIAAGVTIASITQSLRDTQPIVRVMPNTPAQIGEGMSVWTANNSVTPLQKEQAQTVLGAMGKEIQVDHEHYIDMATAISGSGPAYVFLFMEAMIDAAVHLGFSRLVAQQLVEQTIKGSIDFAQQAAKNPTELRNQVTSPGGTTAAALYEMEKGGLRTIISDAIWAAYKRAVELGSPKSTN